MAPLDGSSSSSSMRQRWGHGIDIRSADEADITQYTEWRISVYEGMVWRRPEDLVDYYADDFKDFTRDTFNICPSDVLKRLRDCLRKNGIYVRKGRGVQIANELYKAVHEDSPWPDDDDPDDDDPDDNDPDSDSDQSITTFGTIDGRDMLKNLADQSTYHILTKDINTRGNNDHSFAYTTGVENKYNQKEFYDIVIDTASNWSTIYGQYMKYENIEFDESKIGAINVQFGMVRMITINPPPTGRTMFHVVDTDTPIILCLRNMNQLGIYFDSHPMHGKSPGQFLHDNVDFNYPIYVDMIHIDSHLLLHVVAIHCLQNLDKSDDPPGYVLTFDNGITITQNRQIDKTTPLRLDKPVSKTDFIAQRARGAYIASVCQPQASFTFSFSAQTPEPGLDYAKVLNKCLTWQKNNKQGLKFIKLDLNTLKVVAFTDSSFANNDDYSSQIGFVIVLADGDNNANIVHWSSIKCKRVTRSVLASELYALTYGFDIAAVIKATLTKILKPRKNKDTIPLVICIDSKSLYDCLVKLGTTREKRLMVDLMCLRQAYERREIAEILWIDGNRNPADAMTKATPCGALKALVASNKVDLAVDGWVKRGWNGKKADRLIFTLSWFWIVFFTFPKIASVGTYHFLYIP